MLGRNGRYCAGALYDVEKFFMVIEVRGRSEKEVALKYSRLKQSRFRQKLGDNRQH